MRNKSLWTKIAVFGFSSVLAVGCSKDDDKGDKGGQPATPISAFAKKVEVNSDQGTCTIVPGSNVEGVSYECQVVVNGQAGDWQVCEEEGFTFAAEPGLDTKVKVKAITKDGKESKESLAQTCSVQGTPDQGQDLGGNLVTEITDKNRIGQVVASDELTVTFAVLGADVNPNDIRYECKRESETAFSACPLGNTYEFRSMLDGSSYSLEVRAVHMPSNTLGAVDGIAFKVQLPKLMIENEDILRSQKDGSVNLEWANLADLGATRVLCSINNGEALDCTSGPFSVQIGEYPRGAHTLVVESYAGESLIGSHSIPFCSTSCNEDGQLMPRLPQTMPIGKNYVYALPGNMHITQYAVYGGTSWASNVQFWRIANATDPFYDYYRECGVNIFDQGRERLESRDGPNGPLDYCYSSMDPAQFKSEFNSEYAFNHIEAAATDESGTTERVLVASYDSRIEFNLTKSKFWKLCGGEAVTPSPEIPLVNDYFGRLTNYDTWDRILSCYTHLNGFGTQERWNVGSFIIATDGTPIPYQCYSEGPDWFVDGHATFTQNYCRQFRSRNIIEVTYMARNDVYGFGAPYEFMGHMQDQFFNPMTRYRFYSQNSLSQFGPGLYQTRPQ